VRRKERRSRLRAKIDEWDRQRIWSFPLFHTHPGHVRALDELGQQGPGAVPALVGVAALLVVLVVAAASLKLAPVASSSSSAAAAMVVAPSAAVSSAAVHVRLLLLERRLVAMI
jgi:hypothetical protein